MKHFTLLSVLFAAAIAVPAANAKGEFGAVFPDRPSGNIRMLYTTNPAMQCYLSARDGVELKAGLEYCNAAMRDPMMNYRARIFVNRAIIRHDLGDNKGALTDFGNAINQDPSFGDAYLNEALVLVDEKRPMEALAAIGKGIALGAPSLHLAYYARAAAEDDAGNYAEAYRDYQQALAVKPDYEPAKRQLTRFKVTGGAMAQEKPAVPTAGG
jgi:tetratricopeptide (TPR) repeat protein